MASLSQVLSYLVCFYERYLPLCYTFLNFLSHYQSVVSYTKYLSLSIYLFVGI